MSTTYITLPKLERKDESKQATTTAHAKTNSDGKQFGRKENAIGNNCFFIQILKLKFIL